MLQMTILDRLTQAFTRISLSIRKLLVQLLIRETRGIVRILNQYKPEVCEERNEDETKEEAPPQVYNALSFEDYKALLKYCQWCLPNATFAESMSLVKQAIKQEAGTTSKALEEITSSL